MVRKKTVRLDRLKEIIDCKAIKNTDIEVSQIIFLLRDEFSTNDIEALIKMFTEELVRRLKAKSEENCMTCGNEDCLEQGTHEKKCRCYTSKSEPQQSKARFIKCEDCYIALHDIRMIKEISQRAVVYTRYSEVPHYTDKEVDEVIQQLGIEVV